MARIMRKGFYQDGPRHILWCTSDKRGYSIPCDENGTPDEKLLNDYTHEAWADIQANKDDFKIELESMESGVYHPLVLECDCGHELTCDGFTSECINCGKLYNGNGQRLVSPHLWFDVDSNETLGDIQLHTTWSIN